jgi:hypothetical protein
MPLIDYVCDSCGGVTKCLYKTGLNVPNQADCKHCKGVAKRRLSGGSSSSKIVVDNGVQARAVEIYPDVMEVRENHAKSGHNRGD